MNRILLIDDEDELSQYLSRFLTSEGFSVVHAWGQTDGLEAFSKGDFDCVLLDVSLADGNGFSVCSAIRASSCVPIIFLTASGDEACTVAGFEIGADDYVSKPFRPRELTARIKNAIRRKGGVQIISCGGVQIDVSKGAATKNGEELFLSALEYRLLLTFFMNKGRLISRERLTDELWAASGEFVNDNTVTVYIKRLREKIEDDPSSPKIIKTVRGMGYKAGD